MRITLLTILIIIICSCGRKSTNEIVKEGSVIMIDLLSEPVSTVKKLSEFATDIEYFPLQTTKSSLMGGFTRKIVSIDKRVYISNSENILCFGEGGKFLYKIEKKGRGPQEYTNIADFDVSSDNKLLTILSSLNRKLSIYAISDTGFTFQRSVSLSDPSPYRVAMVPETDNIFLAIPLWSGKEPTLSLLINSNGDTIHFKPNCYKYEMVRTVYSRATNEVLVYSIGNIVCFKEEFSDTVFYVDAKDNLFKSRIIFDSHGTLATAKMRGSPELSGKNTTFIANIFETSRYIFYYSGTYEIRNRILFDKTTKAKYGLNIDSEMRSFVKDDQCGGPDFNIEFRDNYCSDGKLFSFVEAIALKRFVACDEFKKSKATDPKKKDDLRKLADSLNETDNPVLIVLTLKK
jgi:hypothetical protein